MDLLTINPEIGAYALGHLSFSPLDLLGILWLSLVVAYLCHCTYLLVCLASRLRANLRGVRK